VSEQAFLGEVATWTGIVTGTLMFASPALFARWKWRGVAGATPAFMLWTGLPFFVGCVLYNVAHPGPSLVGTAALRALVMVGAVLQVRGGSLQRASSRILYCST
jgi:AAA family ATP:ADP antiporter